MAKSVEYGDQDFGTIKIRKKYCSNDTKILLAIFHFWVTPWCAMLSLSRDKVHEETPIRPNGPVMSQSLDQGQG